MEETMKSIILFAQPFHGQFLSRADLENNFLLYQYMIEAVRLADETRASEYSKALEDFFNTIAAS